MSAAPDVVQLDTIVAVAFEVAIEELVGVELDGLSVGLDLVDGDYGIGIRCRKSLNFEQVNNTSFARIVGLEGQSVGAFGIGARNLEGGRRPTVFAVAAIAGQLGLVAIFVEGRHVVDAQCLSVVAEDHHLHRLFGERKDAHIGGGLFGQAAVVARRIERRHAFARERDGLVLLVDGECALADVFHVVDISGDDDAVDVALALEELHRAAAVSGVVAHGPRVACKVGFPRPRVAHDGLVVGHGCPAVVAAIEIDGAREHFVFAVFGQVNFPCVVEPFLLEGHVLGHGHGAHRQRHEAGRGALVVVGRAEVVAHGKRAVARVDRAGHVVALLAAVGHGGAGALAGGRHEERVAVGSGELDAGHAVLFGPDVLAGKELGIFVGRRDGGLAVGDVDHVVGGAVNVVADGIVVERGRRAEAVECAEGEVSAQLRLAAGAEVVAAPLGRQAEVHEVVVDVELMVGGGELLDVTVDRAGAHVEEGGIVVGVVGQQAGLLYGERRCEACGLHLDAGAHCLGLGSRGNDDAAGGVGRSVAKRAAQRGPEGRHLSRVGRHGERVGGHEALDLALVGNGLLQRDVELIVDGAVGRQVRELGRHVGAVERAEHLLGQRLVRRAVVEADLVGRRALRFESFDRAVEHGRVGRHVARTGHVRLDELAFGNRIVVVVIARGRQQPHCERHYPQ